MYGFESLDYLAEEISGLLLRKSTSQLREVVEVATITILHEEIKVVHCLLNIVKADDVGATYAREYSDLALQVLLQHRIQIGFLDDLAGQPFNFRMVIILLLVLLLLRVFDVGIVRKLAAGQDHLSVLPLAKYCRRQCVVTDYLLCNWVLLRCNCVVSCALRGLGIH